MRDLEITIYVEERAGLARETSAVRIGVPFSRGSVFDDDHLVVADDSGKSFPHQAQPLAHWSDGSIKWLLVDILVRLAARQRLELRLKNLGQATVWEQPDGTRASEGLAVRQEPSGIEVDTGAATFRFDRAVAAPIAGVKVGGRDLLTATGAALKLTGVDGRVLTPKLERMYVAQQGPLTTAVIVEGVFADGANGLPMSWRSRAFLTAGSAAVQLEIRVRNPRAARHAGGLWDLGDPGSWLFKDLSVCLHPATPVRELRWYAEGPGNESTEPAAPWTLYQDSSGGEQWNCDNHLDRNGKLSVSVRGYQIRRGADLGGEGLRATPCLLAVGESGWVSATVCDFWQNFPKALRWQDDALCIGLFPGECAAGFELQGGEQKRHTLLCDFGEAPRSSVIEQLQAPPAVWIEPAAVERSKAVPYLIAREASSTPELYAYIDEVIAGPRSFQARREIIDEYGWRNFGDLYADHEAVNDRSARPFISHYNNQYDFIYGGLVHYLASGELRWRELAEASARHVVDIDIYHTGQDKAAFNGGLFWHTDHYRPARTCTHRTYSRHNLNGSAYGGGPSNEHNYTSGLLLHHYLSGDAESAQAVRELADWVIAMDDGSRTLLGLFDASRTGHASSTVTPAYHKPGRGAGNSINALLDAYALTLDRGYMAKAEELLQRCVHPADDIEALDLRHPEHRWSYLVFLQVLGKYLDTKVELGELDYHFYYARESLLHYAAWMRDNEVPYKDILDRVELPTETWPAHDVRKTHVLHIAAKYAPSEAARAGFRERAGFFFGRCLQDVLSFETAYLTRPLVILCVYGHVQGYFSRHPEGAPAGCGPHSHQFGRPVNFVPQRAGFRSTLRDRLQLVRSELARLTRDRLDGLKLRVLPPR